MGFHAPDIRLEVELEIEKVYEFNATSAQPELISFPEYILGEKSFVDLAWEYQPGFESYELEYVYWDSYANDIPGNPVLNSNDNDRAAYIQSLTEEEKNTLFDKAVRISTWKNDYQLDVSYPEGFLFYRVRGVGYYLDNNNNLLPQKKYGQWSTIIRDDIGTGSVLRPFEENKNWQFTVSFAEDGKTKKVMSFYDGSLRNRQVLTNLNDANVTLVAETDYSLEGQGTLSILPAPVDDESENNLFFKLSFNVNSNGVALSLIHI